MEEKVVTVVCSSTHCYKQTEVTNNPLHPPFCDDCKANKKG